MPYKLRLIIERPPHWLITQGVDELLGAAVAQVGHAGLAGQLRYSLVLEDTARFRQEW
jgi:hypothetical protein